MIRYTITSGTPSQEERLALEEALKHHKQPTAPDELVKSAWARPVLRTPLPRKA